MIAAVVPAAGSSKRMGQPKLLVEFDGQTVIGRVVGALRAGGVERVVVIAPPADAAEGPAIAKAASTAGAEVVVPATRPAEMRESIEHGLERLARGQVSRKRHGHARRSSRNHAGDRCRDRRIRRPLSGISGDPDLQWPSGPPHRVAVESRRRGPVASSGNRASTPWWPSTATSLPSWPPLTPRSFAISTLPMIWSTGKTARMRTAISRPKWNVTVRLFALAKERAGRSELTIELAPGSTVADLRTALADRLPALAPLMPSALIAVDEEYASEGTPISPGSRLAMIPPVSGGAGDRSSSGRASQTAEDRSRDD